MTHPFTANTRSIAELFSDDYVLTVPQYHRTYAWPESLARAFLDDLLGAFEDTPLADDDAAAPYFLGCMVMIKSEEHPHSGQGHSGSGTQARATGRRLGLS